MPHALTRKTFVQRAALALGGRSAAKTRTPLRWPRTRRRWRRRPPVTSVLLSTDMFTLIDEDAIQPFDSFVKTAQDKAWLDGFFPAFMLNSRTAGKTWGIPFQRSTVVMYSNKELFKEAGLDPNKPPASWAELKDMATKLTKKDAAGKVVEVRCTYAAATRGGDAPDGRKVKATMHWVSAAHAVEAGLQRAGSQGIP